MFIKLQPIDTNYIHILHSLNNNTNTTSKSNNNGNLSLPQKPPIKKHHFPPHDFNKKTIFFRPKTDPDGFPENPDGENGVFENCTPTVRRNARVWLRKEKLHTKCSTKCLNENEVVRKGSNKWARYGGCIPAILEALERVSDLDEAFKPWELRLSNKERTIILKEQRVWQRAMEIFEWFKMKGCYELNVIHYNIMIRILGKARKWVELEMLRDEMEKNGIESINSTYGTLIDVYSKGGVREKAMY